MFMLLVSFYPNLGFIKKENDWSNLEFKILINKIKLLNKFII